MIDWMIIILISFMLLLLIGMFAFGIMFVFKKRTVLTIFMPNNSWFTKMKFGNLKVKEKVGDGEYIIDGNCEVKTFWGTRLFYYYGNPNPIKIDINNHTSLPVGHTAQHIKVLHESNLIDKLFATENKEKLIVILVCIVGALVLANIGISMFSGNPPVELANSGNNSMIIQNAVKVAIRGG